MKNLRPKTRGQKTYLEAIKENQITFCLGPAGTGKTAISTRFAVNEFLAQKYEKLVLVRPMVQAGEETGFLPGDINGKMMPYVIPIFDELKVYMDVKQLKNYIEQELIEIVPLAYMRGRSFHKCFIIADEMQNASKSQLKMLLTRIGYHSKLVVNGDTTQCDLPIHLQGALELYSNALCDTEGIQTIILEESDIVREPIVARVLKIIDNI